jgi:hypothetical protein
MRLTVALVALAAAVAAPLAAGQAVCTVSANAAALNALTATSTIKRTTVKGGSRIVQQILIKNTATTAAAGLTFSTTFDADETFLKGKAHVIGGSKPTVTATGTAVASSTFSIPAGKTLKATVASKRPKRQPVVRQPAFHLCRLIYPYHRATRPTPSPPSPTPTRWAASW